MASYGSSSARETRTGQADTEALQWNFFRMTLCFAVNHGVCTTPLIVASSLLGEDMGDIGNGIFYVAAIVGALFVAAPVVAELGLRRALVVGGSLYCIYIGGFGLALITRAGWLRWVCWALGSLCGGVAGSVFWVAQGGYFAETATKIHDATGEPREAVTGRLAGTFSFFYLLLEVVSKVGFSLLQGFGLSSPLAICVYLIIGLLAVLGLYSAQELKSSSPSESVAERLLGVTSLWPDPLIWLLSPINLTFGFSAAFMNGHVNGVFVVSELGEKAVAAVGAITPLVAAVFAKIFGQVVPLVGKGPVIVAGAVCFLCIPVCLLVFGCCGGWGKSIIVLYVFQGLGRAVYESTNRAAFADFYPGKDTQNAFANCALQANAAFAASFFLQTTMGKLGLATVIMVLALLTPFCFWASQLQATFKNKAATKLLV